MASELASVNMLKDAIIAEMASDVLQIKEDVQLIGPLVDQLKAGLPAHFDLLKAGLIQTLNEVEEDIKAAGGERIDFVKGQLHVFIEQAINKAFSEYSENAEKLFTTLEEQSTAAGKALQQQVAEVQEQSNAAGAALQQQVAQFDSQNKAAAAALRAQFNDVSEGMSQIQKEIGNNRFPTWAKVTIPVALVLSILCSAAISWQLASYKEALYMQAFMSKLEAEKETQSKQGASK